MPHVNYGNGKSEFGPGVEITLTGDEVAGAIDVYLLSQKVIVRGARTVSYNGELLNNSCRVYVDPSGFVIHKGHKFSGRGYDEKER